MLKFKQFLIEDAGDLIVEGKSESAGKVYKLTDPRFGSKEMSRGKPVDPVQRDLADHFASPSVDHETTPFRYKTSARGEKYPHISEGQPLVPVKGGLKQIKTKKGLSYTAKFAVNVKHLDPQGKEKETTEHITIPINKFTMETSNTGKYSDEQAFIRMFNVAKNHIAEHGMPGTKHDLIAVLHDHITKAEHDPSHEDNINSPTVEPSHFVHGNKTNETAHASYYDFLTHAAHGVASYMMHPDFVKHLGDHPKTAIKHIKVEHNGKGRGQLTKDALNNGLDQTSPVATAKSDVIVKFKDDSQHGISLKRGPAQLASGSPEETRLLLKMAINKSSLDPTKKAEAHSHAERIYKSMAEGKVEAAKQQLEAFHNNISLLNNGEINEWIHHLSATGQHKFPTKHHGEDPRPDATHIVEMNPGGSTYRLGTTPRRNQMITSYTSPDNKKNYLAKNKLVGRKSKNPGAKTIVAVAGLPTPKKPARRVYDPSDSMKQTVLANVKKHLKRSGVADPEKVKIVSHVYTQHGHRVVVQHQDKKGKRVKSVYHVFEQGQKYQGRRRAFGAVSKIKALNSPTPGVRTTSDQQTDNE